MLQIDPQILAPLARKYIWWKTPEQAVASPRRVVAQVMNLGDYADVQALAARIGEAAFADVLRHAEAGEFSPRSWAYWHYRLGLATLGNLPPMPSRKVA